MTEPTHTSEIVEVVERLPPEAARKLLRELDQIPDGGSARIARIRQSLLAAVNRRRTQLARRLFTTLFEPFLCSDAGFLDPACAPPGVIHRLDVGALWHALATQGFGALAARAQERLTELTRDTTIEQILTLPDTTQLLEDMSAAAVATLEAALQAPDRLRALIDMMNRWRDREAAQLNPPIRPRPLTRADVELYRDVLVFNELVVPLMILIDKDRKLGRPLIERADALLAATEVVLVSDRASALPALLPLTILNEHRLYKSVASLLHIGGQAGLTAPIIDALERHLRRICTTLADGLTAAASGDTSVGPIIIPENRRTHLTRELDRFQELMQVCAEFDLLGNQRVGAICRDHIGDLISKVERAVYPKLLDRFILAANNLHRPLSDHEAVCWLAGAVCNWRRCFQDQVHWGSQFNQFRQDVVDYLRRAFRKATVSTEYSDILERFEHLGRIDALAAPMGLSSAEWLTSLDHSLIRILTERLKRPEPLGSFETRLCAAAMVVVERELAQIKYWKDPLLLEFATLAGRQLVGDAPEAADADADAGAAQRPPASPSTASSRAPARSAMISAQNRSSRSN